MLFPLRKKEISFNMSETKFLSSYNEITEIPLLPHPGAFAKVRKNHQHEGIDLYCNEGDEIIAMEDGIILNIFPFTGEQVGSPWWNNTWAILIETESGVFNYGELIPNKELLVGQKVKEGDILGKVTPVLMKDKGRPMNMLHLEMYTKGTKKAIDKWDLQEDKPKNLMNPTQFLINIILQNDLLCNKQIYNNKKNAIIEDHINRSKFSILKK